MRLPNRLRKWISRKRAEPKGAEPGLITRIVILLGLVLMLMVIALAPEGPSRYCRCPDQEMQDEAQQARRKLKAVRTPAAERVRQALKEWEREQAKREAAVRAAIRSREELDAAAKPAAEVAPR